jgi:DNA-binding transcriptional regulator YhcF (GntR family)
VNKLLDTSWFATFRAMFAQGTVAKIGAVAYCVYSCIKSHADFHDGLSIPSQKEIARETGLSERAVQKSLKILEEHGLIERSKEWKHNVYRLKERMLVEDKRAIISWTYLPAALRQARQEIHKFLMTGDYSGAKVVNIERLEVTINIVQADRIDRGIDLQDRDMDQGADLENIPDTALREQMRRIIMRTKSG